MPMNRMMLAFLLISAVIVSGGPIIEPAISSELFDSGKFFDILENAGCTLCDDLSNCTQGDLMLSPNEINFDLQVMFFNGTITRTPIVNAPLVIYIHNESMEEIYKMYTDNEGVARFSFAQWSGACHDYTIFHCKDQYGCDFTTCIDAVGIDRTALGITDIDDVPLAPDGTAGSGDPQDPPNVLPTYTSYRYCPPPPPLGTTMPVFCLPLVLIMMFLLGSMFLSGKNPFIWFDFSSPRMGKYIRYTARGRGFGFDMMSIASAATTVVSIAKNPKAMMKKDQARLKKGGAFGGIAATVRGGVKAVPGKRAIKRMAKKGAKWGKGGGKEGAKAVWGTVVAGYDRSAIGQIDSMVSGAWKEGGASAGLKALGLALARYSSFGQLVNAIQTARQVWAVAGSVGEAIQDRDAWKGTATVKDRDGKEHSVVMTTKEGKFVPMVDGKAMSMEAFEKFQGKLTVKDKEQIVSLRNEGFDQIQRVNRTVLFFRPLEISNRNEGLAGDVNDTLKDAKKDTSLTYTDASGAQIKITAGELKDIASQEKDNPTKPAGVVVSVTDKKGKITTKIVSAETFLDMKAAGTKVERKADVSLSGVMAGLDAGSKTVQGLGIKGAMDSAKSLEGMKQMVAATDLMYKQLETIKATHTANFNKSREALSKAVKELTPEAVGATMKIGTETKTVAEWVKEGKTDLVVTTLAATKPGEAPKELAGLANTARRFYNDEAAHTNNFISIFNNSSRFSDSVQKGYELKGTSLLKAQVHAQTVITQLTAVANNRAFDVSLLEGIDFSGARGMARSKKAMMASVVANKGLNLKNEAEREKYLKGIETQKAKITDIAPEKRTPEQRRLLEIYTAIGDAAKTMDVVGAKHPEYKEGVRKIQSLGFSGLEVTQKEALLYKSQALASMADLFSRPAPAKAEPGVRAMGMKQVGGPAAMNVDYRMEKAALTMLYDISANPKQGLNTLSMFNALKGAKNDPARFNRMAAALENYSLSDYKPTQRYEVFNKLQLQDATNRFGDAVRIHTISNHVGAEEAISAAVKKVADSTAVSFIKKERAEYKSASDNFTEKYTELRKAKDSGIKGTKLKKYQEAVDSAERNMKRERDEYYRASFNALGGTAKVDAIIKEHVPPGSNEWKMWNSYQDFRKTAEKTTDYNAAAKKLADVKGKGDPYKPLRDKKGAVASFKTTVGLTAPTPVRFSYNPAQVTHSEVFDGVQSSGQYSYAQLKAMGYIR